MNGTTRPEPLAARPIASVIRMLLRSCQRIPDSVIALLARFSIAAIFWQSGQTKVEGWAIDLFSGTLQLGWPRLSDGAVYLFREEYRLPLLEPELAALLAATAEHLFPLLLLLGLGTRLAACGLLIMTLVIQVLVYPDAYATHGVWAACLLFLLARGPGVVSVDQWLVRQWQRQAQCRR